MMPSIQPITENRWGPTFKPKPEPIFTPKIQPLTITWNKLPPHFELPDDPVDNFAQPLLAEALRETLEYADLLSPTSLVATNFGLCATVDGQTVVKAPDWVYVPDVIPIPEGQDRKSYTPYKEGALPEIVMEFLSDDEGREYDQKATPLYGKWFFYEQILKVPIYAIFNPSDGTLEVYLVKSGRYQRQKPDKNGRYWIDSLELFLGVWHSPKRYRNRTGYWLRWWDKKGNLLLWGLEKNQQTEKLAIEALKKAEKAETTTKLQIAKQMRQANAEIGFIMQVTGLDKASIEAL
jgi:Uma2 family endonuclease